MAKKKAETKTAVITLLEQQLEDGDHRKQDREYAQSVLTNLKSGQRLSDVTIAELSRALKTDDQIWIDARRQDETAKSSE